MTPRQFIDQLGRFIADEKDAEALEFAERVGPSVVSRLSNAEYIHVLGLMESAQLAVDLQEAAPTLAATQPDEPLDGAPDRQHISR